MWRLSEVRQHYSTKYLGLLIPFRSVLQRSGRNMYISFLYLEVPSIVLEIKRLKFLLHIILSQKLLESNTLSKDNVNHVNTESNSDHIYSGIASTLHFHDNHTPLLEHCASKCDIQWVDENDPFTNKTAVGQVLPFPVLAEVLWSQIF